MPEPVWIGEILEPSAHVVGKLAACHQLAFEEVQQAIQNEMGLRGSWEVDSRDRTCLKLFVNVRGERSLILLYPVNGREDDDTFRIGTAYPV